MGSNESFPPPPPPGQQPGFQPTQQMPTQAYPQQAYAAQAATEVPKKGNGMLIGGGLVVAAALIGGVVLLTGGDDDKKSTTITLAPVSTTVAAPDTTLAIATTVAVTDTTVVDTTIPEATFSAVFDDLGFFSMTLPDDLELDTTAYLRSDGFNLPRIAAADSIDAYNSDDVTFGLSAFAAGPDAGMDASTMMDFLEPPEGACTGRSVEIGRPTAVGAATQVSLTGCGVGGGNKVLLVVQLADRPVVIGLYMQSVADVAALQPFAQSTFESIFVF